ncbi:hypothetical protein P8452_36773 [Trifolium repens]|nr:hypothetical protein P8452_36773 [Trifolium repens]
MYPQVNVTDGYAAHSQNNHPPQGHVLQMPSYGMPQPYAPRPYMTSTTSRVIPTTNQWSTGLCHCLDDPGICLVTCFFPCITFGLIAEIYEYRELKNRGCDLSIGCKANMERQGQGSVTVAPPISPAMTR